MAKENVSNKSGFKYFLAALGPGFILAATSIGPGSIVSSTNAGANFGYNLFWWFVVMLAFRAVFSLAMNRYTVVTGKPLMVGIREKYGPVWAVLAGVFAFLGQCVYGIGNFMGAGLGFNMLFPSLPVKWGGVIAVVICAVLFFLKNLYKKMENVMKVLVGIMALIFVISLIGTLGIPYDGTVSHSLVGMPAGSTALMLSLLGTTASLGTCAWGSSLAKDKGYTVEDICPPSTPRARSTTSPPASTSTSATAPSPTRTRSGRASGTASSTWWAPTTRPTPPMSTTLRTSCTPAPASPCWTTSVRGSVVMENGEVHGVPGYGKFVTADNSK